MNPRTLIRAAVEANTPVMVTGTPGTGKTTWVETELGATHRVVVVPVAVMDPTDFLGLPVHEGGRTVWAPPSWAADIDPDEPTVVFLDEITVATPSVLNAMLRMIYSRQVGMLTLPGSVRFVAAGNPADAHGGAWHLPPAIANRFVHVEWTVDVDEWVSWLVRTHGSDTAGHVAGYVAARPGELAPSPPLDVAAAGGAWPSPRSWAAAVRMADTGAGVEHHSAFVAAVGEGAAIEFAMWRDMQDLPAARDVLAGNEPDGWWGSARTDRAHAVCMAVAGVALSDPDVEVGGVSAWDAAWAALTRCAQVAKDVPMAAAEVMIDAYPTRPIELGSVSWAASLMSLIR